MCTKNIYTLKLAIHSEHKKREKESWHVYCKPKHVDKGEMFIYLDLLI